MKASHCILALGLLASVGQAQAHSWTGWWNWKKPAPAKTTAQPTNAAEEFSQCVAKWKKFNKNQKKAGAGTVDPYSVC